MIDVTSCPLCGYCYERYRRSCPDCGETPKPVGRSRPEEVCGDLYELDEESLAVIDKQVREMDLDRSEFEALKLQTKGMQPLWARRLGKLHVASQEAQKQLRHAIEVWGGHHHARGVTDDRELMRLFFLTFEIDTYSARALDRKEAEALTKAIRSSLGDA